MPYFWSHCRCPSCFLGWAHATCVWAPASFPLIHSSGRSASYQPTLLRLPPTPTLNRFSLPLEQNPQLLNTVSKTLRGLALVHSSNLILSSTPTEALCCYETGPLPASKHTLHVPVSPRLVLFFMQRMLLPVELLLSPATNLLHESVSVLPYRQWFVLSSTLAPHSVSAVVLLPHTSCL